jgi:hypothetical protein
MLERKEENLTRCSVTMVGHIYFVTLALVCATTVNAFPAHRSLAGLSGDDLDQAMSSLKPGNLPPPPGPLKMNGTKLVDDPAHPFRAPRPGDLRGPCPGLNALASHGVRIVSPATPFI